MQLFRTTVMFAAASTLAVSSIAVSAASASDRGVSSDGRVVINRGAPATMSAPSVGTDAVSRSAIEATGATLEGAEAVPGGGIDTVAFGNASAGRQARTVVGWDSRMRTYTTSYPNRAIVLITRNGNHHCTGWMISRNTVATAGHCVHSGGSSGSWYAASTLRVYPGYDGTGLGPYGSCTVRNSWSVSGWTVSGSADFDYGAMRINCTIGSTTGWFGLYVPSALTDQNMIISGYPGDKPRTQWTSSDRIRSVTAYRMFYRADTVGGHSGSPLWNDRNGGLQTNGAWAIGIHAYGANSANMNSGAWLRSPVVTNMINWINAP